MYDLTCEDSWEGVKHWHQQLLDSEDECPGIRLVIIGTRKDRMEQYKDVNLDEIN